MTTQAEPRSCSPDDAGAEELARHDVLNDFHGGPWRRELDRLTHLDLGELSEVSAERYGKQTTALSEDGATTEADHAVPVTTPTPASADALLAAGLPPEHVAALCALASGPRTTVADLDRTLDAIAQVQSRVDALEGMKAVLVERARRQAVACEDALVDDTDPTARAAGRERRRELAQRALVADVAATLHLGETAAASLIDHARTLTERAPRTLAAVSGGVCSWRHAVVLATHVADLDPGAARAVESAVLTEATTATPAQFDLAVRRARDLAHPVPIEVRHSDAVTRRGVWVEPGRDGMAWLTAHLPAVFAHAMSDRLGNASALLRAAGDVRTTAQLRADVLTDLLLDDGTLDLPAATLSDAHIDHDGAGGADGAEGGGGADPTTPARAGAPRLLSMGSLAPLARSIRPRVSVTVPVLTMLGLSDAPAMLDGHTPIDADTARALCAHAPSFRRILTHPETGAVLSVGRTTYAPPADLKALLAVRDATCRFPGCTRPAHRTDVDHTTAWADGGLTEAANLAHLCRRHHVLKHQTRWTVQQVAAPADDAAGLGGVLEWTSPTGRTHRTAPAARPVATIHHGPPPPFW